MQTDFHEAKKSLQSEAADKLVLSNQIGQYKKIISASSQVVNQVSDDIIRAKSDQIFYMIQDFVVKNFKGVAFGTLFLSSHEIP